MFTQLELVKMSLDFYDNNNYNENIDNKFDPENNLKPEAKAARQDVIETAIRNMRQGASSRKNYIEKAYKYKKNFGVFTIDTWLEEGKKVFGIEEIKEWANSLPYPQDDIYYF